VSNERRAAGAAWATGDGLPAAGKRQASAERQDVRMPARRGLGIELLADRTRRHIVAMLAVKPCRPSTIARELGLSRPTITHHLRLLQQAELIRIVGVHADGRFVLYAIDPGAHGRITAWLAGTEVGLSEEQRGRPVLPYRR
jgi:DNA-binding transcriptional ArsR family regulator